MKTSNKLPVIGITMGDPAGIGPEITAMVLSKPEIYQYCNPIIFGDINIIEKAFKLLNSKFKTNTINSVQEACCKFARPDIINLSNINADNLYPGISTAENGKAMLSYIYKSVEVAKKNEIDGIVTCPVTKTALKMAGSQFHGHTELIATLTNTKNYNMMFVGKKLKVVLVTIHIPLSKVSGTITVDNIFKTIEVTSLSLEKQFGINKPHLAVAGLNPHAGENSMFGLEEYKTITPAVKIAKQAGFNVTGPIPPDTLFHDALMKKQYDCIVCMYHDQGLIPFKMLHFNDGVNTTIGLPIIRTSCDHGTAYDIAWKGVASPDSLLQAILSAAYQANAKKF